MNVVLISHCNLDNSAIQVFSVATELTKLGVNSVVCVPGPASQINFYGTPQFPIVSFSDAYAGGIKFQNGKGPDLIHAWTPREYIRRLTEHLVGTSKSTYVVHLEDNEEIVLENELGLTYSHLLQLPADQLDQLVPETRSHPLRYRDFISAAAGVTALIDRLLEFKPQQVPGIVFWPGYDPAFLNSTAGSSELRRRFGVREGGTVVVYNGNIHHTNSAEMRSLFLAIQALRRIGRDITLLWAGSKQRLEDWMWDAIRSGGVVELGFLPRAEIYLLLAAADILVQPGTSDRFNDYRFPSKVPEFLATGKPVILPRANVGRFLLEGSEALLLDCGNAIEIAEKIERLIDDPALAARIGAAGKEFALRRLTWSTNVRPLVEFYASLLRAQDHTIRPSSSRGDSTGSRAEMQHDVRKLALGSNGFDIHDISQRYARYSVRPLSYGTVRDYCDSADNLSALANANADMKDLQRPWALKAILGRLGRKGRLLEIGAGEPLVADLLQQLGHEVWIIDPYDGSGHGPTAYEQYQQRYEKITFVRSNFSDRLQELQENSFDCIYSISVLEHIPQSSLEGVFAGMRRFLREDGVTIHAIDHVHRGRGADEHLTKLRQMVQGFGLHQNELAETLAVMNQDIDTYYLSAEGHNRWRGDSPYDGFPMRICVSIQVVAEASRLRPISH